MLGENRHKSMVCSASWNSTVIKSMSKVYGIALYYGDTDFSLHIPPPINIVNVHYHSLLGDNS